MADIVDQLNLLNQKVEKLIAFSSTLKSENEELKQQNKSLQLNVKTQEANIKEMNERIRVLKLARSVSGDSEKSVDIKQKINEFVRELDKCIDLIGK